jgi:hypothetical protein
MMQAVKLIGRHTGERLAICCGANKWGQRLVGVSKQQSFQSEMRFFKRYLFLRK